jgi:hypothetical protein
LRDRLSIEKDLSMFGFDKMRQREQERAFSRAVRTDNCQSLAAFDIK